MAEYRLFKSIKGLVPGNVELNFIGNPESEFDAIAQGYHDAGKLLVADVRKTGVFLDFCAYPIVFLYRHSLELYLKAIVLCGAKVVHLLDDKTIDYRYFFFRHSLLPLLPAVEAIWSTMNWNWDFRVEHVKCFDDFRRIVCEIESLDKESFSFRYPVDKRMNTMLPKNFHFNILHFADTMDPILECLDGAVTGIEHRWDEAAALIYEAERIIRASIGSS